MIYNCDVYTIEKSVHIGVCIEAESKEEALKKAKNFDWKDCMDQEGIEVLEVVDVDFYD